MHMHKIALATALSLVLATWLPSLAAAQLSPSERYKAEQVARIQAKAMAEEQAKQRRSRLDLAKTRCRGPEREWDFANEACVPNHFYRPSGR